ncbi:MAG: hypothetical protein NTY38_31375 [Acidobacteria bacterium]|nr:hypothetical protein [Acidobacteriota bacterium]
MTRLVALALLLSVCLAAQAPARARRKPAPRKAETAAPAPVQFPIEKIVVLGNRNYTAEQIIRASGLKTGITGTEQELAKLFEEVRNRLLATGFFERAGAGYQPAPSGKGYLATLEVTEMAQVFSYRFENLSIPPDKLEAALRQLDPLFSAKIPASQPILDRYVAEIQRPSVPLPNVAEVRFTGTSAIPEGKLRAAVAGAAVGTPYTEKRFRQMLELSARPVYEAQGYLRASFGEIRTEQARDVNGLVVSVKVDEGGQYKLHDVLVHAAVDRPGDLVRAAKFKVDDVANIDEIEAGRKRIEEAMKGGGHFQVKSTLKRELDDKKHWLTVTIDVTPGPLYTFGKLKIQGLDLNAEAEVRKLWGLKPGKPFNAGYPDHFLSRVREDGYFENLGKTSSSARIDEAGHTVEVTLLFQGCRGETRGILRQDRRPEQPPPPRP